jgi:aconitase A
VVPNGITTAHINPAGNLLPRGPPARQRRRHRVDRAYFKTEDLMRLSVVDA